MLLPLFKQQHCLQSFPRPSHPSRLINQRGGTTRARRRLPISQQCLSRNPFAFSPLHAFHTTSLLTVSGVLDIADSLIFTFFLIRHSKKMFYSFLLRIPVPLTGSKDRPIAPLPSVMKNLQLLACAMPHAVICRISDIENISLPSTPPALSLHSLSYAAANLSHLLPQSSL